jgi:2-oxoglutarate ferredoxin oxidoreductase subunit gamma
MTTSIVIAGFGGQGVLFAGQLLAYAGMDCGRHVTWIPSYGPEMRGGTANCTVMIDDEPIGAPTVSRPENVIVLNEPSFEKYEPLVRPGGLLVINSSLVRSTSGREDVERVAVPATKLAEELGTARIANMVALGALLARRPLLPAAALAQAVRDHLPPDKAHLLDANIAALRLGSEVAQTVKYSPALAPPW